MVLASLIAAVSTPVISGTANAGYVCPVEDRTTRPNNGGAHVSTYPVAGLDLSHWNTGYTWAAVKAAGQSFVYYKASQGTYMIDQTYYKQTTGARKVGLLVGAYHFFDYRLSGISQARYFVAAVKARGGFHGRLRPVVDVECSSSLGKPIPATAVTRLRAYLTEVQRLIGVKPIIYTSIFEWNTVTAGSAAFSDTALWSAEWAKTAPLKFPPSWTKWTFWQYGGKLIGTRRYDGNVFVGSLTRLRAWLIP